MSFSRRAVSTLAALSATALVATGCGAMSGDNSDDGELRVAAGYYPLAWVAERVAGDAAEVTSLSRPGQDAHDAELTMNARAAISDADLVLVNGGFQPGVDQAAEQSPGEVLDAAEVLDLRPTVDHDDHDHGASDDDHDEHGDDEHDGHDHGDVDPHFWLDPLLMADLADRVAESLGTIAPDEADDFAANAAELRDELEELDADYTEGLSTCARSTVVVSHDAFGYLSRYGLEFEPIAGLSPGAEPTPADLARLRKLIRDEGVTTVFNETLAPVELADSLARSAGVSTAVLDPIEGLPKSAGDADYFSLMRDNLAALRKANGC
ncbi:metal ABC transporter substrate-binding protein [Nocardioides jishulii]|uniref:Zinc ABC transporter substrate-binding protein n=1 Tax=Nocardioides jishulii TaxID=2575440 RepID=A0A4V5TK37_9ACTN|nr:metal ABC transporter substrate-binding protein [Nocardioides jishulii]QCX27960.1 zinc ABC transporter substrate-binding protein [Nocardioides jishulii]TKI60623.1 zinc ABC transporter substrate-binding protein [Nocardioides jishulii]